jgi:copper transport protein
MTSVSVLAVSKARRHLLTLIVVGVSLVVLIAPSAGAHAVLIETQPGFDRVVDEPPGRVTLRFSEPVETALGSIRVFDSGGERVDAGSVEQTDDASSIAVGLETDLPGGTYTTTWSVVSGDSHPVRGAFVWHVGAPGTRPQGIAADVLRTGTLEGILFGVARWLIFGGLLLLAGTWSFTFFIWRLPRTSLAAVSTGTDEAFRRRTRRLLVSAWITVVAATFAAVILQTATAAGVTLIDAMDPNAIGEVLTTRYGRAALLRLGVLIAVAVAWLAWGRTPAAKRASRIRSASVGAAAIEVPLPPWALIAGSASMLVLLATPGLAGHAASADPPAVNLVADTLHLAAAAVWIGGLATLFVAVFPATADVGPDERTRALAPVIARFSDIALIAVAAIVVTGTYRSWVEVGALKGLTTSYGLVLLTKIAVFLPLLALGAINNRVLKPRIAAAAHGGDGSGALRTIRRAVGVEITLAIVVVAVTAVLVNLAPARSEVTPTGPFVTDVRIGGDNLNVLVTPTHVGENIIHLTATEPSGNPVEIRSMRVRFEQPERDIGPIFARARRLAPGHFAVQGHQLSVAGEWRLEVLALIDKFTQQRATVEFEVGP